MLNLAAERARACAENDDYAYLTHRVSKLQLTNHISVDSNLFCFWYLLSAGILALLNEREPELKAFALRKLNNVVDEFWAEISDEVEKM